jgi:hypothetical protein
MALQAKMDALEAQRREMEKALKEMEAAKAALAKTAPVTEVLAAATPPMDKGIESMSNEDFLAQFRGSDPDDVAY